MACLRPLRGALGVAVVALPDRHQRVPRHARRARAARAPDGSRPCPGADRVEPEHAARGHVDPADADGSPRAGRRPGRRRGGARDRSSSPSSPRSSTCRRGSAPCSSSARCCAGRRRRSPSCSTRASPRSTAPSSARGRRSRRARPASPPRPISAQTERELLARYVKAFEAYDMEALTSLIQEDAKQSMPPFDLWLRGRDDILTWWFGPGIGCSGSRVVPTISANGSPAFGQYKPTPGRRLRAVGAAGAGDRGRPHRRVHLLPRHRDGLPALRPAVATRRLASLVAGPGVSP